MRRSFFQTTIQQVGGIDAEWANGAGEVLFEVAGDSTFCDSNDNTGAAPSNNGKIWNGSAFVALPTTGPGDSGNITGRTNGSALQQFANAYYARTGKVACFHHSAIGGTKVFDTWNGSSSAFTSALSDLATAVSTGGFPGVRFLLSALVNDSTAGDTLATVQSNFNAWIDAIVTAYPTSPMYYMMFGIKNAQTLARAVALRTTVREKWISTANLHIAFSDLYLPDWSLLSADGVHPNQTGHNFRGDKIDTYLAMEDLGYSKFARTVINSQYSSYASWTAGRADAINTAIAGLVSDGVWHNMLGYWSGNIVHANDRFVDWCLFNRLTDRGVTYTLEDFVETNTGGATMNIPITVASTPYRSHSTTDTFITIKIKDYKSTTAATRIPFGVSSGTNLYALQVATTGVISGFVRNNTAITVAGGAQDNTRYSLTRNGTAVDIYANGVSVASGTSTAGADISNGPEIGDRYTAGPAGFPANMELQDWGMGLASAVDQADLYARLETLYAAI